MLIPTLISGGRGFGLLEGRMADPGKLHLWTQREAAAATRMCVRYLRDSDCPKVLLPSLKPGGRPSVRYDPEEVMAWARAHSTSRLR